MPEGAKPGRNDRCPCKSGRKYKHCCADKDRASAPATTPPAAALDALRVAERHLRAGEHEQALAPLAYAARAMPDNPAVLHTLGRTFAITGRIGEATTW